MRSQLVDGALASLMSQQPLAHKPSPTPHTIGSLAVCFLASAAKAAYIINITHMDAITYTTEYMTIISYRVQHFTSTLIKFLSKLAASR